MWGERQNYILLKRKIEQREFALEEYKLELESRLDSMKFQMNEMKKIIEKQTNELNLLLPYLKNIGKEINKSIETDRKNLGHQLTRISSMQTAEYIMQKMIKVRAFPKVEDLWEYALSEATLQGMYLEFGVYSARSINYLSKMKKDTMFYGFDSFEGLPEDWRTGFHKGLFKCDLPEVNENVTLIKGYFDETLPEFVQEHSEICAFVHVDCDLYSSAKTIFEYLKNQIKSGTIILFDEYFNYPGWQEGEYKAFQEFIAENQLQYEYLAYRNTHEQVLVRIL